MEEKTSLLSKFLQLKSKMHIFANMNDADILSITKNIRLVKFNPGELIIKEGFTDDDIYYILKGEYNIVANRQVIGSFGADTLIGEMASLAKTKRTASVRANSEVIVFSFRINYEKERKASISFYKFYKNIAMELIRKLETSNVNK